MAHPGSAPIVGRALRAALAAGLLTALPGCAALIGEFDENGFRTDTILETGDLRPSADRCGEPELDPATAQRACSEALRLGFESPGSLSSKEKADLYVHRGGAYAELGAHLLALSDYEAAAELYPVSPAVWTRRGWALIALARSADAVDSFEKSLALEPEGDEALLGRGAARTRAGDLEAGAADLRLYAARRPDSARAQAELGRALTALGDEAAALEAYDAALALDPSDADARLGRADILAQRDADAARAEYREAARRAPENAEAHYRLGRFLLAEGDAAAAHAALFEAYRLGLRTEWLIERMVLIGRAAGAPNQPPAAPEAPEAETAAAPPLSTPPTSTPPTSTPSMPGGPETPTLGDDAHAAPAAPAGPSSFGATLTTPRVGGVEPFGGRLNGHRDLSPPSLAPGGPAETPGAAPAKTPPMEPAAPDHFGATPMVVQPFAPPVSVDTAADDAPDPHAPLYD